MWFLSVVGLCVKPADMPLPIFCQLGFQTCQVSRISRETHAFSMSLTLSLRTVEISRSQRHHRTAYRVLLSTDETSTIALQSSDQYNPWAQSIRYSNFALALISTLVRPALITGFKQPLKMNDFATFDMLPWHATTAFLVYQFLAASTL